MPNKISSKTIALSFGVLVLLFLVGFYTFAALWEEPSEIPPEGNVDAPINTGSTAQTKQGDLTVQYTFRADDILLGGILFGEDGDLELYNSLGSLKIKLDGGAGTIQAEGYTDGLSTYTLSQLAQDTDTRCDTSGVCSEVCIGTDCKSFWPSGNGGGGDITEVAAGSGLIGGGTSGPVTLNVGQGTGINVGADSVSIKTNSFSCDPGSSLRTFNIDAGTRDCETDDIGGGGGGLTGGGNTNRVSKWTGGTSLGDSIIYDIGSNIGINNPGPDTELHVTGGVCIDSDTVCSTPPDGSLFVAGQIVAIGSVESNSELLAPTVTTGNLTTGNLDVTGGGNCNTVWAEMGPWKSGGVGTWVSSNASCGADEIMTGGGCSCFEDEHPWEVMPKQSESWGNNWYCRCIRIGGSGMMNGYATAVCCF